MGDACCVCLRQGSTEASLRAQGLDADVGGGTGPSAWEGESPPYNVCSVELMPLPLPSGQDGSTCVSWPPPLSCRWRQGHAQVAWWLFPAHFLLHSFRVSSAAALRKRNLGAAPCVMQWAWLPC